MRRKTFVVVMAATVLLSAAIGQATMVRYREGGGTQPDGAAYTDVTFDQTDINKNDDNLGNYNNFYTQADDPYYTLIGIKDLFTVLPLTSADDIYKATLTLIPYWGDNDTVTVTRCLTDWLVNAAGSNQNNVTGAHCDLGGSTTWSAGNFSDADHDTANGVSITFDSNCYRDRYDYDVTDMVKAMYSSGNNYGFVVSAPPATSVNIYANSNGTDWLRPVLKINYDSGSDYFLTVNSGEEDGYYASAEVVYIFADAAPSGMYFDEWVGDTAGIANVRAPSTTLTMPASNAEITATYTDTPPTYTLTVNSGTGSGTYQGGSVNAISADAPPSGLIFAQWTGNIGGVQDIYAASTNYTMPFYDAELTATYGTPYTLTVNSGSGSGSYTEGRVVQITADAPPSGQVFFQWTGDTNALADPTLATTDATMPAGDVEVTATYTAGNIVTLTVNSGTGGGTYIEGQVIAIVADPPPTGVWVDSFFDVWVADTVIGQRAVTDLDAASTNITMPAIDVTLTATYSHGTRVKFREGGGTGYVDTMFDDVYVKGPDGPPDSTNHNDTWEGHQMRIDGYNVGRLTLLGLKDQFTLLPPTTAGGNVLRINKAKVLMYRYDYSGYGGGAPVGVHPMTDGDWFVAAAGTNEIEPCGNYARLSDSTQWTSGSISTADWDENIGVDTILWPYTDTQPGDRYTFDITPVIEHMYLTSTNKGMAFVIRSIGGSYTSVHAGFRDSEAGTPAVRPVVIIDYDYVSPYTLTVNSGSGGGTYGEGVVVPIEADYVAGYMFVEWVGDTAGCASTTSASTTYTMPAANAEITATYTIAPQYQLTVNSGSGTGQYGENVVVDIVADTPATGWYFDEWTGDVAYVADVEAASTTVTMPAQAVTVTATYEYLPYDLTVNSGWGTGHYDAAMEIVVAADVPPAGQYFDKWVGDTSGLADPDHQATKLTMPSSDVEITATYTDDVVQGERVSFRDGAGTGYVDVEMDDTYVNFKDQFDDSNYGTSSYLAVIDGTAAGDSDVTQRATLIGIKDMFTKLTPSTNGNDIQINKARLLIMHYHGPKGTPFYVARVTTDWLIDAAGIPQTMATGTYARFDTDYWADFVSFSSDDYDDVNKVLQATMAAYARIEPLDITSVVQDIYTSGNNYGFALIPEPDFVSWDPTYIGIDLYSSEQAMYYKRPVLQIDYQYGTLYTLTVNSGTGGGSYYSGTVVAIQADAAPTDMVFDQWVGDTDVLDDPNASSTNVTMPAGDVEVTATYVSSGFVLTVNSGTGDGQYAGGTIVSIAADPAPTSELDFREWVGDTAGIADVYGESTTLTMPSADQEVTATYRLTGDLNRDGFVGQTDLDYVLDDWGEYTPPTGSANPWADQSGDGFVGQTDLDYVLDDWGQSYP